LKARPSRALAARDKPIGLRVVELGLDLDDPSKLDRSAELIERRLAHGAVRAPWSSPGVALAARRADGAGTVNRAPSG
jgi:hypothetical protein